MPTVTRRSPYLAYLRVFGPVEHLPPAARERWTRYAAAAPSRREVEAALFADTVRRLAGHPPVLVPPAESDDAIVLDVGGVLYVCPQQPRLQVWQRLEAEPDPAVPGAELSQVLRDQAAADLAAHAHRGGEVRLFTQISAWQVPLAWFVPFAGDERTLSLGPERSLRYRTSMGAARRRAAKGLRRAREGLGDVGIVDEIELLSRWLEEFDPRSLVELDYGGLVDLLDDVHLAGDDSAADVAEGLAALAEGDTTSAAAAYQRWTTRWQRVQLLARAS